MLFDGVAVQPRRSMNTHARAANGTDQWLTPRFVIEALGPFDLDPCASSVRPWPTAAQHYTQFENGLVQPWHGRVWLNPPYSETARWLRRMVCHGDGVALLFARTETRMFFESVWDKADALLFLRGRLTFFRTDGQPGRGNSGGPSVLVAYGEANAVRLGESGLAGKMVWLRDGRTNAPACQAWRNRHV